MAGDKRKKENEAAWVKPHATLEINASLARKIGLACIGSTERKYLCREEMSRDCH